MIAVIAIFVWAFIYLIFMMLELRRMQKEIDKIHEMVCDIINKDMIDK